MIDLLRDEFVQEVPMTREALTHWQNNPAEPPEGVQDMLSFLDRSGQAVETLGMTGFSAFLRFIEQYCGYLIAVCVRSADHDWTSPDDRPDVPLGVFWLGQWVDEADAYLENPADPVVVEGMASYLRMCPHPIDEDLLLELVSQLLMPPQWAAESADAEPLAAATDEDVALSIDGVDPELLQALLADAPQQLQKLEDVVAHWGDGNCSEADMLEAQRVAHTIKGSGNIIGLPGVARLAHRLEDILEYAVNGIGQGHAVPAPLVRDIIQAAHCLQQMVAHLQGDEVPPSHAKAVLQRLLDWVGWIRDGQTLQVEPDPLVESMAVEANAELMPTDGVIRGDGAASRTSDTAVLRVGVTQLSRMLRRAGQSIVHSERVSQLLVDADTWLGSMERNNQVLATRLRELEVMVSSQVVQLRQAQEGGDDFDPLEFDRYDALHGLSRFIAEAARDSTELVQQARASASEAKSVVRDESHALVDQHRELLAARLVAVKTIIPRLKRTVAQTANTTGKSVALQVVGEEVAMDADVLARLAEPLLHLLRNAIDHGIELPQDRVLMGKPEQGIVRLDFQRAGEEVVLRVRDDGRGLDLVAIETRALNYGLIDAETRLNEVDLHRLILQPGFSTRDAVTETSGRGVGMDIVNDRITGLKGRLDIDSTYGEGCCFTLHVPVSSGVAQSLVVQSAGEVVALPQDQIESIVAAGLAHFSREVDGGVSISYADQKYPAFVLAQWLDLMEYTVDEVLDNSHQWLPVLVKGTAGTIALLVDEVLESRELILQDMGRLMRRVKGMVGGALRADGRPLFLFGITDLEHAASTSKRMGVSNVLRRRLQAERTCILVVDDAWSVRRSMQQLLEDAGYEVMAAADGYEALDCLRVKRPALILTDLEMPNLNGLELTRRVREVPQWSDIPVVMITSRTSDKHRAVAVEAGVDMYLTKPYQDADLLTQVRLLCVGTLIEAG